jgi:hypothetical protein
VLVRAGSFDQHAPGEPARRVTLTADYWLGRHEVTRGQFARFVADTRYVTEAERGSSGGSGWNGKALEQRKEFTWRNPGFAQTDDHPVCVVTWNDAGAFCEWLARRSGLKAGLPTEAQWEHACRAGTTGTHHGGESEAELETVAWFAKNAGDGTGPAAPSGRMRSASATSRANAFRVVCRLVRAVRRRAGDRPARRHGAGGRGRRRQAATRACAAARGATTRAICASGSRWRSDPRAAGAITASASRPSRTRWPASASRPERRARRGGPDPAGGEVPARSAAAGAARGADLDAGAPPPQDASGPASGPCGWIGAVVGLAGVALVVLILVARRSSSPGGGMAPRAASSARPTGLGRAEAPSLPAVVTVRHRRRGGDCSKPRARARATLLLHRPCARRVRGRPSRA